MDRYHCGSPIRVFQINMTALLPEYLKAGSAKGFDNLLTV